MHRNLLSHRTLSSSEILYISHDYQFHQCGLKYVSALTGTQLIAQPSFFFLRHVRALYHFSILVNNLKMNCIWLCLKSCDILWKNRSYTEPKRQPLSVLCFLTWGPCKLNEKFEVYMEFFVVFCCRFYSEGQNEKRDEKSTCYDAHEKKAKIR